MASTSVAAAGSGEEGIMCKHACEASSAPPGAPTPGARVAVRPGRRPDADERLLRPAAPPATGTVRPGIGAAAARFVAGRLAEVFGPRSPTASGVAGVPRAELARLPPGGPGSTRQAVPAVVETAATGHGLGAIRHGGHAVSHSRPGRPRPRLRCAAAGPTGRAKRPTEWPERPPAGVLPRSDGPVGPMGRCGSGRKSGLQGPVCVACQPVMPRRRSRSGQCLTRPHGGPRRCDSGLRSEWWDREVQILSPRPEHPFFSSRGQLIARSDQLLGRARREEQLARPGRILNHRSECPGAVPLTGVKSADKLAHMLDKAVSQLRRDSLEREDKSRVG
jgi:hypothetical protein